MILCSLFSRGEGAHHDAHLNYYPGFRFFGETPDMIRNSQPPILVICPSG